jgi:hypothetical protein
MQGPYYLAMLIGVVWLCLWACFPKLTSRVPSPFDMLGDDERYDDGDERARRGAPAPQPPPAPADVQHPVSKPGAAKPWRLRREQAAAPGGQRGG